MTVHLSLVLTATFAVVWPIAGPAPTASSARRAVVLKITPPKAGAQGEVVTVAEGGIVRMTVDERQFGFQPTVSPPNSSTVRVAILEIQGSSHVPLGTIEAQAGGSAVRSKTSPSFAIQVVQIVSLKGSGS